MISSRRRFSSLRSSILVPWCLLLAVFALGATPAFRQLLIDPASKPTVDVSFSSAHWTGTLDAARLPGSVVQYSETGGVPIAWGDAFVGFYGGGLNLNGEAQTDGNGNWSIAGLLTVGGPTNAGCIAMGNYGGNINTSGDGGFIDTSDDGGFIATTQGGYLNTSSQGGFIDTSNGGGWIMTNGSGDPATGGYSGPVGSIYMDQTGRSGYVLWVMETTGWVGK